MIEAYELTKRYGDVAAVGGVSFTVRPGMVTGFLGRNGAGKSTTMRMVVGLHRPTSGSIAVSGRRYGDLAVPLRELGTLLDAKAVNPGMSARDHLRVLAVSNGIPKRRVDEVLDQVGLAKVAGRRTGTFSLGMGQRLGIAGALLGDPPILMFDEPLNGLDPDGVHWLRALLRELADEGRTVFLSSHLMSEMALVADRLIVLDWGRLIADTTLNELLREHSNSAVVGKIADPTERRRFVTALGRSGSAVTIEHDGRVVVQGIDADEFGRHARDAGVALSELVTRTDSLEDVFMSMTRNENDETRVGEGA